MTETTTPETLAALWRDVDQTCEALRRHHRDFGHRIDAMRVEARPVFPTADQLKGIDVALDRIERGVKPKSHHGEHTSYPVTVDGARGWLSVNDLAPYSMNRGGKLWGFTDDEVEVFLTIFRDLGWVVEKSWRHVSGLSIVIRPAGTPGVDS